MIFKKKQDATVQQTAAGEAKPAAKGGKAAAFFRKNWKWMVPVVCVAVLGGWFILRPDKAQDTNVDYDGTTVHAVGGAVYYSGFAAAKDGKWQKPREFPAGYEIHLDKPSLQKTLYTNYQIALGGTAVQWTPAISYWALAHPVGGGGCTYAIPRGIDVNLTNWSKREWQHPEGAIVRPPSGLNRSSPRSRAGTGASGCSRSTATSVTRTP